MEDPCPASRIAKVSAVSGVAPRAQRGSALSGLSTADSLAGWEALLLRTWPWNPSLDSPALLGAGDVKHHDINHFLLTFARFNSIVSIKDE